MRVVHLLSGILLVFLVNSEVTLALTSSKMEDGDFLKITSVPTGNVLTLSGSDTNDGRPLTLGSYTGQPNQKFLAVEALVAGDSFLLMPQRQRYPWQRFIRNGGTSPYRNRHDDLPDWTLVLEGNTVTGAVTQDARDGKMYQQWRAVKVESPAGGKTKYLLKNRQNNQCLTAPGPAPVQLTASTLTTTTQTPPTSPTTKRSFFGNIWSSIRSAFGSSSNSNGDSSSVRSSRSSSNSQGGGTTVSSSNNSNNVVLTPCNNDDARQHWQLEAIAYEY